MNHLNNMEMYIEMTQAELLMATFFVILPVWSLSQPHDMSVQISILHPFPYLIYSAMMNKGSKYCEEILP